MTAPLALIAAVARNRVIGGGNRLLWRIPSDLRRFKALTLGKPLLMGRKTYELIGRPLPGRETIVVTRDAAFGPPGAHVAHTLDEALALAQARARDMGAREVIVAGGGELYAALISQALRLYVTEVDLAPEGDAHFPAIDQARWREIARQAPAPAPGDEAGFAFVDYVRSGADIAASAMLPYNQSNVS